MECPKCGKAETAVVDSRLTKDQKNVRRRRECSACSNKFITFEITEENLLPFLVRKNLGDSAADGNLNTALAFITNILQLMSEETGNEETAKAAEKIVKAEKPQPEKKAAEEEKPAEEKTRGRKPRKVEISEPEKNEDISDPDDSTATDTVLKIIKKNKKGIDVAELKDKTGFNDKKIRNIVHRASKQGKIKRVGRGLYVIA